MALDPVSVEITYGLDRIVMYLQGKSDVWSIAVDGTHTFADVYRMPEIEHCVYNFELADVERLKQIFDIYQAEAQACIARRLVIPAHDFILRQSHTPSTCSTRGAIGVTERAKFFAAMRSQYAVAELYIRQREQEEFPWLDSGEQTVGGGSPRRWSRHPTACRNRRPRLRDLILELGSEELPAADVVDGMWNRFAGCCPIC